MLVCQNHSPRKGKTIPDGPDDPLYFYKRPMLVCQNNSLRKRKSIPDGPLEPLYFYKRPMLLCKNNSPEKYLMVMLNHYISTSDQCW